MKNIFHKQIRQMERIVERQNRIFGWLQKGKPMKTVNGTKVVNIDIIRNQAIVLLDDAYDTITERLNQFRSALNDVMYPRKGKFREAAERYDSARERTYAAIAMLDDMAEELFPLFDDEEKEPNQ